MVSGNINLEQTENNTLRHNYGTLTKLREKPMEGTGLESRGQKDHWHISR